MASNNRKRNQTCIPNSGGASKKSATSEELKSRQDILDQLNDMFEGALDPDIIQSVARYHHFKPGDTVDALIEITKKITPDIQGGMETSIHNANSKEINVPELPLHASYFRSHLNTQEHKEETSPASQQSFLNTRKPSSLPDRATSPGLGTIKVTYRSPNNCEDSDSDADVVIEEEKEYDMVAENLPFSVLNTPYPMPQFLIPVKHQVNRNQSKSPPKCKQTKSPSMSAAVTKLPTIMPPDKIPTTFPNLFPTSNLPSAQERVYKNIQEGVRVMVLMRGAPGSGKSYLAKQIIVHTMGKSADPSKYIFSTDDFFVLIGQFIPSMLPEAHKWNRERVKAASLRKCSPIIVDNTNTE